MASVGASPGSTLVPGSLKGTFGFNNNGAATYEVPIHVPPGTHHAQPNLTLRYDSSGGDGLLGRGWSLGGLSSITRCGQNLAVDDQITAVAYNADDRFMLDGERLIVIAGSAYGAPGSQYRTHRESWRRIVANPDSGSVITSFTVTSADGSVSTYGGGTASILAVGTQTIRVWALSSTKDLNGNVVNYAYTQNPLSDGTGAYYPETIQYTSNQDAGMPQAERSVDFVYTPEAYPVKRFEAGGDITRVARLANIRTSLSNVIVHDFRFEYLTGVDGYTTSLLSSVQVCDSIVTQANCLPPTQFDWSVPASAFAGKSTALPGSFVGEDGWTTVGLRYMADVNGDGLSDIVGFDPTLNNGVQVALSIAPSAGGKFTFGQPTSWNPGFTGGDWSVGITPRYTADINGDGMADIVGFAADGVHVALSNASAFVSQTAFPHFNGPNFSSPEDPRVVADVNGDGRADLVGFGTGGVWVSITNSDGSFADPTLWSTGFVGIDWSSSLRYVADINGDGMADIVGFSSNAGVVAALSDGNSSFDQLPSASPPLGYTGLGWSDSDVRTVADVNGDGMSDIVAVDNKGVHVSLANGNGFEAKANWNSFTTAPPWNVTNDPVYFVDVNGDSFADLVAFGVDSVQVFASTGTSFAAGGWDENSLTGFGGISWSSGTPRLLADVDGDGLNDVVGFAADAVEVGLVDGSTPALMVQVTNGFGGVTQLGYLPLSHPAVYSFIGDQAAVGLQYSGNAANQAYSIPGVQGVVTSVSRVLRGGTTSVVASYVHEYSAPDYSNSYSYAYSHSGTLSYSNGLYDVGGYGWLGFETTKHSDHSNKRVRETTYGQQFPETGLVQSISVQCESGSDQYCTETGLLLHSLTYEYDDTVTKVGTADNQPQVYFVQRVAKRVAQYDYGTYQFSIGHTYHYDDYGNQDIRSYLGFVNQNGTDIDTVDNVYTLRAFELEAANVAAWRLNYLQSTKTSTSASTVSISTFEAGDLALTTFQYDGNMNRVGRSRWDDTNSIFLNEVYTYDGFGNRTSAQNAANFTTSINYDTAYHTFKASTVAPPSGILTEPQRTTTYGYDPRFGSLSAKKGPNGSTHVVAFDAFGRAATRQGPVPTLPASVIPNDIELSHTTNQSEFESSRVLTLREDEWQQSGDSVSRITRSLLSWPTAGDAAVFSQRQEFLDGKGRKMEVEVTRKDGVVVSFTEYGSHNKVKSSTLPYFTTSNALTVNWERDAYGRIVQVTYPNPSGTGTVTEQRSYKFNDTGLQATITTAYNSTNVTPYVEVLDYGIVNGQQKLMSTTVGGTTGPTTSQKYDVLGRYLASTDPMSLTTLRSLDSLGRVSSSTDPARGIETRIYDDGGRLLSSTNAYGQTNYAFDARGRLLSKTLPDGSKIQRAYDSTAVTNGLHRLTSSSVVTPAGTTSSHVFGYDSYGRLSDKTVTVAVADEPFEIARVFEPTGRLMQQTYPDESIATWYYVSGLLTTVKFEDDSVADLSNHTALGSWQSATYGNNVKDVRVFAATGALLQRTTNTSGGAPLVDSTFSWNDLGQLSGISDAQIKYDDQRLKSVGTDSFAYDDSGNLKERDGIDFTYNNRYQPVSGTVNNGSVWSASYDDMGNLASKHNQGDSWSYTYDKRSRLTSVTKNSSIVGSFGYDYLGNRVRKVAADGTITVYVDSTYEVITPPGGDPAGTRYVFDHASPILASTTTSSDPTVRYFHRTIGNSTVRVTDGSGVQTASVSYLPYGGTALVSGVDDFRPKFLGREQDSDTGLYYFGSRYLDPTSGRYLSADSKTAGSRTPQDGLNRYAFSRNDPMSRSVIPNLHTQHHRRSKSAPRAGRSSTMAKSQSRVSVPGGASTVPGGNPSGDHDYGGRIRGTDTTRELLEIGGIMGGLGGGVVGYSFWTRWFDSPAGEEGGVAAAAGAGEGAAPGGGPVPIPINQPLQDNWVQMDVFEPAPEEEVGADAAAADAAAAVAVEAVADIAELILPGVPLPD